jgi:hypothetical protein
MPTFAPGVGFLVGATYRRRTVIDLVIGAAAEAEATSRATTDERTSSRVAAIFFIVRSCKSKGVRDRIRTTGGFRSA